MYLLFHFCTDVVPSVYNLEILQARIEKIEQLENELILEQKVHFLAHWLIFVILTYIHVIKLLVVASG